MVVIDETELCQIIRRIVVEAVEDANKKKVEKYYTVKEACEMLRISVSTLHRWRNDGSLKTVKRGAVVIIPAEEIQKTLLNFKH